MYNDYSCFGQSLFSCLLVCGEGEYIYKDRYRVSAPTGHSAFSSNIKLNSDHMTLISTFSFKEGLNSDYMRYISVFSFS